ncbi:MAG: tetratricopeptide repeat protein [Ignavibacteria bacterium]|nr:tetratricopeptide repeat protein [Ignavibacteria bacterium]
MSAKRFRIAFSFAGEKRDFVAKVAEILAGRFSEEEILYDKYHQAEFSRSDLAFYLPDLYEKEADLVVAVFCPDYENKEWCGLEWNAIFGLLKKRKVDEVMLTRFGRVEGKGLRGLAGYTDLDDLTPWATATLILERLAISKGEKRDSYLLPHSHPDDPPRTTTPNNLPRLQSFFGRTDELKKIADALSPKTRTWGALIDGPGGMGKTSLAIRAAELAPTGQFLHIFFLSSKVRKMTAEGERRLSDFVTPGYLDMLNEIARLLKQPDLAKQPETDRARLLIDALAPAKALLILDNLESMPKDQQNRLFEFLSQLPPGCKAIATSRRRTDVDARIIRLAKLDQDAALALIADLATDRPLLAKATAEERIHLYEETGGNPLLLRWVAGQLGRGRCRTIASALDFIRSVPADNDPLEFIFGDLLDTFTENETKVLAALTYFTQQVEVKLIAELANISKTAAETALGDLSSRALVVPDEEEKRFALVPMVADFLRRKRPEVVAETGSRLEERAYALIVENGYEKHDRFPILGTAWPTVAPALPLFVAGPNPRLQTVCDALFQFFNFTGRYDESLSFNQQAEARAVATGDHDKAGWRAYMAGWIHSLRRQADAVLACADRATAHWQTAQAGARERATAIRLRGLGHKLKKDYPAAITAYRESLDLSRTLSAESQDVAGTLNALASAEKDSGDLAAAEPDYREALRVARAVGDTEGVATYTGNLAALALDRKDWPGAETLAREALPLSEKVGRQEVIAVDCHRLAQALLQQGKPAEALPHARRAVEIFTQLGVPSDIERARATLEECEA